MKPKVPKGRFISTVTIGEKGQIVIPKAAREMFGLNQGTLSSYLQKKNEELPLFKTTE